MAPISLIIIFYALAFNEIFGIELMTSRVGSVHSTNRWQIYRAFNQVIQKLLINATEA